MLECFKSSKCCFWVSKDDSIQLHFMRCLHSHSVVLFCFFVQACFAFSLVSTMHRNCVVFGNVCSVLSFIFMRTSAKNKWQSCYKRKISTFFKKLAPFETFSQSLDWSDAHENIVKHFFSVVQPNYFHITYFVLVWVELPACK